jgi:hypothetical protein
VAVFFGALVLVVQNNGISGKIQGLGVAAVRTARLWRVRLSPPCLSCVSAHVASSCRVEMKKPPAAAFMQNARPPFRRTDLGLARDRH